MNIDLFVKRASVRNFKPDEIPQDTVELLLCAAIEAPSAGNRQPWHFYAVRSPQVKKQLRVGAYMQAFIETAPLVIVVCAEPQRSAQRYGERGIHLYAIQDTAAAIENILLCAAQNGLGSCWCGAFDEDAVSTAMALPADRRPVAMLAVGYPEKDAKKPARRPFNEAVTFVD